MEENPTIQKLIEQASAQANVDNTRPSPYTVEELMAMALIMRGGNRSGDSIASWICIHFHHYSSLAIASLHGTGSNYLQAAEKFAKAFKMALEGPHSIFSFEETSPGKVYKLTPAVCRLSLYSKLSCLTQGKDYKPFPFFDLPAELRNTI